MFQGHLDNMQLGLHAQFPPNSGAPSPPPPTLPRYHHVSPLSKTSARTDSDSWEIQAHKKEFSLHLISSDVGTKPCRFLVRARYSIKFKHSYYMRHSEQNFIFSPLPASFSFSLPSSNESPWLDCQSPQNLCSLIGYGNRSEKFYNELVTYPCKELSTVSSMKCSPSDGHDCMERRQMDVRMRWESSPHLSLFRKCP